MSFPINGALTIEQIVFLLTYQTINPKLGLNSKYKALKAQFPEFTTTKATVSNMCKNPAYKKALKQISLFIKNPHIKKSELPKSVKFTSKDNYTGINCKKIAKFCAEQISDMPNIQHINDDILLNILDTISLMDDGEQLEYGHLIREIYKEKNKYKMHQEKLSQNDKVIDSLSHLNEITDFMDKLK